jgi:hypothetical protein
MKKMTIWEFLELAQEMPLSNLDIINYVEKVTDNCKNHKLKLFLEEIDYFLFVGKEQYEIDNLDRVLKDYANEGKEIPYLTFKQPKKGANPAALKFYEENKDLKAIDFEKLFGTEMQFHFYSIYRIKNIITGLINIETNELPGLESPKEAVNANPQKYGMVNYALMLVYLSKFDSSISVDKNNCKEMAGSYGFKSPTSGQQFLTLFDKERKSNQRNEFLGDNKRKDSATKNKLEKTLKLLEDQFPGSKALKRALEEYQIYENDFNDAYQ